VSYLYYADRLYQLPLALFGIAIGTVLLPALSARFAAQDFDGAREKINRALEGTVLLTMPCMVAFVLEANGIMAVLFGRGAFDAAAVQGSAKALEAYSVGLLAVVALRIFTPAFHARGDTRTPVMALFIAMGINIALKVVLVTPMAHAGLALATAAGAWINIALLSVWLYRRGDFDPDCLLAKRCAVVFAGSVGMVVTLVMLKPVVVPLEAVWAAHPHLIPLAVRGLAAGLVYCALVGAGWRMVRG
jgi:putative peptidoglycan lipid II flippase